MPTAGAIAAKITGRLGRPLNADPTTATAWGLDLVNWTIRDFQRRYSWSVMEGELDENTDGLVTVASTPSVALPAAYKAMRPDTHQKGVIYRLDGTKWVNIPMIYDGEMITRSWLVEKYADPATTGEPKYCCIYGRTLYFGPTPDAAYSLRALVYRYTAELATNDTNWFTENLEEAIVHGGLARGYEDLHEDALASRQLSLALAIVEAAYGVDAYEPTTRVVQRRGLPQRRIAS